MLVDTDLKQEKIGLGEEMRKVRVGLEEVNKILKVSLEQAIDIKQTLATHTVMLRALTEDVKILKIK